MRRNVFAVVIFLVMGAGVLLSGWGATALAELIEPPGRMPRANKLDGLVTGYVPRVNAGGELVNYFDWEPDSTGCRDIWVRNLSLSGGRLFVTARTTDGTLEPGRFVEPGGLLHYRCEYEYIRLRAFDEPVTSHYQVGWKAAGE